jgi:hypothetical protein
VSNNEPKHPSQWAGLGQGVAQTFGHYDAAKGRYIAGSATMRGLPNTDYPQTEEEREAARADRVRRWAAYVESVPGGHRDSKGNLRSYDKRRPPEWFS